MQINQYNFSKNLVFGILGTVFVKSEHLLGQAKFSSEMLENTPIPNMSK